MNANQTIINPNIDFSSSLCMYVELKPTITRRIFIVTNDLKHSLCDVLKRHAVSCIIRDEWRKMDGRYRMTAIVLKNRFSKINNQRFLEAMDDLYKKASVCGWTVDEEFQIVAKDMKRIAV